MATQNISASIAVRRIVQGDTITLYLQQSGLPLFQTFNPDSGEASPKWSDGDTTCPHVVPNAISAKGASYGLTEHTWKYNGADLKFNTKQTSGWQTSTVNSAFMMNSATGELKIVRDLASASNQDSDTLTYEGVAKSGDKQEKLSKTIDITLCPLSQGAYAGTIQAKPAVLSEKDTKTTLSTILIGSDGGIVTDYSVKWYKGNSTTPVSTAKTLDVSRDDIDWQQVYIAEFYVNGEKKCSAGITIDDIADLYQLVLSTGEGETGVDENNNVTVSSKIINTTTGKAVTPTNITRKWTVYKSTDFTKVKEASTETITVTDADTTDGTSVFDVTVLCEVEFE